MANLSIQLFFLLTAICSTQLSHRKQKEWLHEKMPPDLETEYALSALLVCEIPLHYF